MKTAAQYATQSGRMLREHARIIREQTLLVGRDNCGPLISGIVSDAFKRKATLRRLCRASCRAFDRALNAKPPRAHFRKHRERMRAIMDSAR